MRRRGKKSVHNRIIQLPVVSRWNMSYTVKQRRKTTAASERVPNMPPHNLQSLCGKIWQRSAIKSAVAKACGHMKAPCLSCAGDTVGETANVACAGKSSFMTKTSQKNKE